MTLTGSAGQEIVIVLLTSANEAEASNAFCRYHTLEKEGVI
jgi:hypothetical protein